MGHFNSNPITVSHKQLNKLLASAPKDKIIFQEAEDVASKSKEEFNKVLHEWAASSKTLLKILNRKDLNLTECHEAKDLMKLGALESYLFLAIQVKESLNLN